MRIELTVDTGDERHDVRIDAAPGTDFGTVRDRISALTGMSVTDRLWSGPVPVTGSTPLGSIGLRSGALLTPAPGARIPTSSVRATVVAGPSAGRVVPVARAPLVVGRASDCGLVLDDDRVSRRHACLERHGHEVHARDLGSTNGTRIEGRPVDSVGTAVRAEELVQLGDSLIEIVDVSGDAQASTHVVDGAVLVHRVLRRRQPVTAVEIDQEAGTKAPPPRRIPWIAAALPALLGGVAALVLHSPVLLLFSLLSPVVMLSSAWGDHVGWRRSGAARTRADTAARERAEVDAAAAIGRETRVRRRGAPDPASVVHTALAPTRLLWERDLADPLFAQVRLGVTDAPASVQIRRAGQSSPAGRALAVPLLADLTVGPLGIAGPRPAALALARWVVIQLATLHAPSELRLLAALVGSAVDEWAWLRWLPHLDDRAFVLPGDRQTAIDEIIRTGSSPSFAPDELGPDQSREPWTVILLDTARETTLTAQLIAVAAAAHRVSGIVIAADETSLPAGCQWRAVIAGELGDRVRLRRTASPVVDTAVLDSCPAELADTVARSLAPMAPAGRRDDSSLPTTCRLLPMLGISSPTADDVLAAWAAGSVDPVGSGACTVLGSGAAGPVTLDLERDGPHFLIAGTTGSGKSALLQTLVAGLAARCPPDAINLVLVDYKGGATFAACARLPHTVGVVTDLDASLTTRALRSLDAELRRRERAFAAVGAADLASYVRHARDDRIARLVIVVDEFAALADELPEFVTGLVSVAQRGRSLGLHLVLATQRPGGSVSADIRANVSTRIALRMSGEAESLEVIGSAVAAAGRCPPGRAWLAAGGEITVFQTALIGGAVAAVDTPSVRRLGPWRQPLPMPAEQPRTDDLSALVDAITTAASRRADPPPRAPWLPVLPSRLALDDSTPAETDGIVLGLVDLPDHQAQQALRLPLTPGSSALLVGAPRSGRTSGLLCVALYVAARVGPDRTHLHVVDGSGALALSVRGLPHAASVLGPDATELVATLLHRLSDEVARRAATGGSAGGPALVLLIDEWDAVREAMGEVGAARCTELLEALLRSGPSAGLSVIVAGGPSLLGGRWAAGFTLRLSLRLSDPAGFAVLGIARSDVPTAMPPGRCVRIGDGALVQLADPGGRPGSAALRDLVAARARRWIGTPAGRRVELRRLPDRVRLGDLAVDGTGLRLGLGGDAAATLTVDLSGGARRLLVSGPPRSGRTTALITLAVEAERLGWSVVVAARLRSPLHSLAAARAWPAFEPGAPPTDAPTSATPTLLVVDDGVEFDHTEAGERLLDWLRTPGSGVAVALSGRPEELVTSFRGLAAEVRRARCGVLLRPGPIDGELLGVRLPRQATAAPAGRGWCVGEPAWGSSFASGEPVPVQVALP